jgi:hypothetical protein
MYSNFYTFLVYKYSVKYEFTLQGDFLDIMNLKEIVLFV